jgi:F0F1-type ATP synthase membrane subunit b/b'
MGSNTIILVILLGILLLLFWKRTQKTLDASKNTITLLSKLNEQAVN